MTKRVYLKLTKKNVKKEDVEKEVQKIKELLKDIPEYKIILE